MTPFSWYQTKEFIEHATGTTMDALHILVGFLLFILAAITLHRGLRSWLPWTFLLLIELANEAYDLHVEIWPSLASQIGEGAKDVILTMALPTLLFFLARWKPHLLMAAPSKAPAPDDLS